ncbi:hypothetical protein [Sedimentibacter sp.]|uniref:hypothetical protein n=1 Tax=Sedimentibacter sp. TaxID=1960295 RepID=UPI0028987BBF|nr:hypothetical protein [Sedimentibacter sp.]
MSKNLILKNYKMCFKYLKMMNFVDYCRDINKMSAVPTLRLMTKSLRWRLLKKFILQGGGRRATAAY